MNAFILIILMNVLSINAFPDVNEVQTGNVVFIMDNVEPNKGELRVAIYSEKGFLSSTGHLEDKIIPVGDETTMTVVFENVPYGQYALACYQDKDKSQKLSKTMIGIPNEPYAFSKTPASKWKKPAFSDVSFTLDQPEVTHRAKLKYWKQY